MVTRRISPPPPQDQPPLRLFDQLQQAGTNDCLDLPAGLNRRGPAGARIRKKFLTRIKSELAAARKAISHLGSPRSTVREQEDFLLRISDDFTLLLNAALNGDFKDRFFRSGGNQIRRLRAVVRQDIAGFEKEMRRNGQAERIVDDGVVEDGSIERAQYISRIRDEFYDKGATDSFFCDSDIVRELFVQQSEPWKDIATDTREDIAAAVRTTAREIIEYTAGNAAERIDEHIQTLIDELEDGMKTSLTNIIEFYSGGKFLPQHHIIRKEISIAQARKHRYRVENAFSREFGHLPNRGERRHIDLHSLMVSLSSEDESDLAHDPYEATVDHAIAYYDVSMAFFANRSATSLERLLIADSLPVMLLLAT